MSEARRHLESVKALLATIIFPDGSAKFPTKKIELEETLQMRHDTLEHDSPSINQSINGWMLFYVTGIGG
jgi:hypothetical protein